MLFVVAILLFASVAKGSENDDDGRRVLWSPTDGRSYNEWMDCNGLPAESCSRIPDKMRRLAEDTDGQSPQSFSELRKSNAVDGDVLLTEEQLDYMIAEAEYTRMVRADHSRRKRQTLDATTYTNQLWPLPIVYKFDGTHNNTERAIIQNALRLWEASTCLRFRQISTATNYSDNHILFSKPNTSICRSYVGRIRYIPQVILLGEDCLSPGVVPGYPVHEIGHAIGLVHEQQRSDRDDYVTITKRNDPDYDKLHTTRYVPYHFGSVMHYSNAHGMESNSTERTMQALNPLYQQNMGQLAEISFDDAHAVNIAYNCDSQQCSGSPAIMCQRGGYRDPNNCSRCKCPDGFGGTYCERVADPVKAVCGGSIVLRNTGSATTIKSPVADDFLGMLLQWYDSFQECSWLISGPADRKLTLQFVGEFDFPCDAADSCHRHWVEVKYKRGLDLEGARFCCSVRPDVNITSESSELLVVFKTNFGYARGRGFRAKITVGEPITTATTPPVAASTTTTTTTTRSTTTTATTITTTTRPSSSLSATARKAIKTYPTTIATAKIPSSTSLTATSPPLPTSTTLLSKIFAFLFSSSSTSTESNTSTSNSGAECTTVSSSHHTALTIITLLFIQLQQILNM